ncbi:SDR family NAD(P)-dependent oxidoreductase [Candidatus Parcubacteria bacterium]|nr:SDR family NAD(P)-dependent oxidoreductase [Candidatus Parcubacteria bacterium]
MTKKRVVIITGVSSGIGLATARRFIENGWVAVGTVRTRPYPAELAALAVDIQLADMTRPADLARVVAKTKATYGRIDALVANAGYGLAGPLESLSYPQISDQLAVNVAAAAELARLVIPIMRSAGGGVIVAVSSLAGRMGIPGYGVYSATKFALEGLFESLWYEVRGLNIRLRLIEPSNVKSPFWSKGLVASSKRRSYPAISRSLSHTIKAGASGLSTETIARRIYAATISGSDRLHYPVGWTWAAVLAKRFLPDRWFRRLARRISQT